jgi:hypothetical protein
MSNPFAYAELHTTDRDRSIEFYRRLFDWKVKTSDSPVGPYTELEPGEGFPGGLMSAQDGGPSRWVVYMKVDDVKAATTRAAELGAKIYATAVLVPDAGWFSLCADPAGATFGLWEPLPKKG